MMNSTGITKQENRLVQIGELFSEEFREPLKERVLEVFNQEVEKLLAKKIDKLKGEKGDKGDQGEAGKDGLDGVNGLDGKDGKDGLNGSDGKDGANGKDGIDGKNGLDGANGKDGLGGKDGLNGNDGLDGKDGLDAELDYEFIKKEIAWLLEEWKSNLGDLTGKQGERGEKGKDGTEYPTGSKTVLGEMEEVFRYALPNELISVELSIKGYTAARNICIAKKTGIWDGYKLINSFTNDKIELNPGRLEYSVEVIGTDLVFKGKGHKEQDTEMSVNWTVQVKVL